jgi:subfamily B ATP-binding cassette protein HlyB/CyaB
VIENSYIRFLSKTSIFSLIPDALDELAPFLEVKLTTPGKPIFNKGDIMDSLVIPLQESLSLVSDDKVFLLLKGRAVSLPSLLRNIPITYDVTCEEFNKVLVLPRIHLMDYLAKNKGVLKYLLLMTESEGFRRIKHALLERGSSQADLVSLARFISEVVPFEEGLLSRGVVIFEEGKFVVESDIFSADFKGGEFAGGFHAIKRPNPGYVLNGKGSVRVLDIEEFRKTAPSKSLLEYLGSDPWINDNTIAKDRFSGVSQIPPEVMSEWSEATFSIDPKDIKLSSNDWDSIKETLFMLLKSFNLEINRSIIENRLLRFTKTICFSSIAEILEHHGLLTRIIKWKDDADKLKCPLVVPFGNRIVTLLKVEKNGFCCFDSVYGFYKVQRSFFIEHCPDSAISLTSLELNTSANSDDKKKKRSETYSLVLKVIGTEKSSALKIALLTLCTYALGLLSPKLNELLLDEVLKTEDHSTLLMCISGLFLIGFFTVVFNFIKNKLVTKASMTIDDILTRFIYGEAQKLNPKSFSKLGTGGILNRLTEMEKIRSFFSSESLNSLFNLGSAIVFGAMLASYGTTLIVFVLAYFLVILIIQFFGRKYLYKMNLKEFNLQSKTNSFIGDSISNVLAIKAFSASSTVCKDWESLNVDLAEYGRKSALFSSVLDSFVDVLGHITKICIIWYCLVKLNTPQSGLSFGQLFAVIQLIGQITSPMGSLVNFLTSIEDMKLSIDKVNDIIFSNSEEESNAKHSVNITGKIKFDRVSYKYTPESALVLKEVSLTIYPGQSVAIVGKSGSGKTTIANLIAKESSPVAGRIYFDDVDSSFIHPSEIKSQVGYIQQNNQLFSGSIKSNVAFKDESPDLDKLERAYLLANCDSFIQNFPQKDDNYLAEGGMGLSGGQKQRLTMARTIYADPKIMILDEATSALDSESEGVIITKLLENKGKVTSIIIAHRLSTIRNADFVFVLDKGQIVQEGTHNELIQKEGVYKELFQDQVS